MITMLRLYGLDNSRMLPECERPSFVYPLQMNGIRYCTAAPCPIQA